MIDRSDLSALAKSLGATVREYVGAAIVGLVTKEQLEARLRELPRPEKGERGEKGDRGDDGPKGLDGLTGYQGEKGDKGERGEIGPQGIQGEHGIAGPQGLTVIGEKGEKGDPGERGEIGIRGERGDIGPQGERGAPGINGENGKDGRDGRDAQPAKDGRDGINGKDAIQVHILDGIDDTKNYTRGTWARHRGGVWRATDDGWDIMWDGIASAECKQGDDLRTFTWRLELSSGAFFTQAFTMPVLLDRGIFKEGLLFTRGDVVSYSNSAWVCQVDEPKGKPGTSGDWRLMVRQGNKGDIGPQGPAGKNGVDGKDLRAIDIGSYR